jgi:phosphoglycolate phosphatase
MGDTGPLRQARAWLFDLDGTLLDSLPGIEYSARAAFAACGLAIGEVELRTLIGPPIRTILAKMALADTTGGLSEEQLDRLVQAFRSIYDSEGWKRTPHYAGAAQLLRELHARGKRLFVVTNKPRHVSLRILQAGGTLELFEEVVTRDSREPAYEDKQEMMRSLMERHGLQQQDCLMVGDTIEDAEAALQTGVPFCLMTHGYGDVPLSPAVPVAYRFDHFCDLMPARRQEQGID